MSTMRERLLAKCEQSEAGCWLWKGSLRNGRYGQVGLHRSRKVDYAHRVSYREFRGPIPEGMVVCHRCDVPRCINPDHLFLGSQLENIADCVKKGRFHGIGAEKIAVIKALVSEGRSFSAIARLAQVSRGTARYWGDSGSPRGAAQRRVRVECGAP